MNTEFPKSESSFLNAKDFQDNPKIVTFKGWERKPNEDKPAMGKRPATSWRDTLKYCLAYTFPEWALNKETGEQRLDKDGKPFRNSNYLPEFPHGYTLVYHFEEGVLETGSAPLFEKFKRLQPQKGEKLTMVRTGAVKEEMKWDVRRTTDSVHPQELPEIQTDRGADPEWMGKAEEEIPF